MRREPQRQCLFAIFGARVGGQRDDGNLAPLRRGAKLAHEVDGAKQVSGTIAGVEGETITVASPGGSRAIPFSAIASAKLLLTDKLINATAPLSTEGADSIQEVEDE